MDDLDRSGVGLFGSYCMNNGEYSDIVFDQATKLRIVRRACWKMDLPSVPEVAVGGQLPASKLPRLLERHYHSEGDEHGYRVVTVGICAMNKKTSAPPMQNILSRLRQQDYIQIIIFTDHTILHLPVGDWPLCDCFIAFYSKGFPLEKAIDYVKLRDPMVICDLQMQYPLMDRRQVYEILTKHGVEVPKFVILNREEDKDELLETDDTIDIRGQVFHKPFVEKPVSAEDHKIHIYFPSDYGGGCQKLFRKVNDRSSEYSKESSVRKVGSYIYEDFMPTDGTDVKVYTVGPDYAHAEARKSPALDGKVERDEQGKEVRYPVILTAKEKLIARKVCQAFKQTVCGFDMLRANGKSYVCDVNGFSFVKNSQKYYEDCAQILLEMITAQLAPEHFPRVPPSVEYLAEEVPVPIPRTGNQLELRCVIGIIRHGDRTPKQKMKMIVKHKKFIELFAELGGYKNGQLKIKKPKLLQRVLDIARYLLENVEKYHAFHEIEEKVHKLQQLRTVLEMYGHFSGINRKVQFKLLSKTGENGAPLLLLILKWGGELTPMGQKQAEELGRAFRCMYPGGEGEYASLPGSGFLRLHSTYRHDLKVYASDEGRVQMTAAAFTKGLLDLEGNMASVLVHLVKRDQNATNMLDTSTTAQTSISLVPRPHPLPEAKTSMCTVKERLHELLRSPYDLDETRREELAPTMEESLISALQHIHNPQQACEQLYQKIRLLKKELKEILASGMQFQLYQSETLQTMIARWAKLEKDFKSKEGRFDISKVPDIYDCIKYDLLHNRNLNLKNGTELYCLVMHLADVVIPQEYGITREEKLDIATQICTPLLCKIQADLHHTIMDEFSDINHRLDPRLSKGVISPNRHVRTRLYFTSESHVHTMLNILRYGGLVEDPDDPVWKKTMNQIGSSPELSYMTQIVFMLFENVTEPPESEIRYRVDVQFSPGVKGREDILKGTIREHPTASLKSSPELGPSVWVKRLPVGFEAMAENLMRNVLEVEHYPLLSKSVPSLACRKMSAPEMSFRSVSETLLFKEKQSASVGRRTHKSANSVLEHTTDALPSQSTNAVDGTPDILGKGEVTSAEGTKSKKSPPNSGINSVGGSPPKAEHRMLQFIPSVAILNEQSLVEGGLELAAELASTVEPLLCLHSVPLEQMNSYLTRLTGITLDYSHPPKPVPKLYSRVPSRTSSTSRTPSNTPTCTPTQSHNTTPSHTPACTPTPSHTPTRSPTPPLTDLRKDQHHRLSSLSSEPLSS